MTVKETWADAHRRGDIGPLTGTGFEYMVEYFQLENLVVPGAIVLETGVGTGLSIRGFCGRGCIVSALDICEEAFAVVEGHTAANYLHERVEELPENHFDLAVSHLVTQHMSEDDILKQFPSVIKSLKPTGQFRVQFAGSDIPEENNITETIVGTPADGKVSMLGGRMVRTPEYATGLVEKCGGRVRRVSGLRRFPHFNSYWYWMEVTK